MDREVSSGYGLEHWEQVRREWRAAPQAPETRREIKAKTVDVGDVIDRIFSRGTGVLAEPLPLGQMIDILIDFWEADGLYD